ncbi:hypothetical protein GCM10025762_00480 [Haloechinothrix salitolerans]
MRRASKRVITPKAVSRNPANHSPGSGEPVAARWCDEPPSVGAGANIVVSDVVDAAVVVSLVVLVGGNVVGGLVGSMVSDGVVGEVGTLGGAWDVVSDSVVMSDEVVVVSDEVGGGGISVVATGSSSGVGSCAVLVPAPTIAAMPSAIATEPAIMGNRCAIGQPSLVR